MVKIFCKKFQKIWGIGGGGRVVNVSYVLRHIRREKMEKRHPMYWDTKKRKGMHYYAVIVKEWGRGPQQ